MYVLFLLPFLGVFFLAPQMGLEWLIGGFLIWSLALFTYLTPTSIVTQGMHEGTLEQLALCPWGLSWNMMGIIIANLLYNILITGLLLVAALLTADYSLALPWGQVLFLMLIVTLQGLGIGWMVAGLALNFKRIESMHTLLQPMFIGALAIPWELHPLVRLIPLRWPYHLMERVLGVGPEVALWDLGMWGCLLLSIGYVVIGWSLFERSLRWARKMGHLAHY
jgi:ABC-2 type transport system permease protein